MRRILAVLLLAALAAGCGSAASSSSSSSGTSTAGRISGTYLVRPGGEKGGKPLSGVVVALYRKAVRTSGPVLADPPAPVASTRTDAHGHFVFPPMPGKRYFVAPLGPSVATPGRWARPGTPIVLVGCTNCIIPM